MKRKEFIAGGLALPFLPGALFAQTPSPLADTSKRRVIAGSGVGPANDTEASRLFADWVEPGASVLYLPVAKEDTDPSIASVADSLWELVEPSGVERVDTWLNADIEARAGTPDLDGYGGIYLGDGNPTALLQRLHASGLYDALIAASDRGCVVYGTSAGTMMLGANALAASNPLLAKSDMEPEDVEGLGLIDAEDGAGLIAVPHWWNGGTSSWEDIAEFTGLRVALITDGSAWTLNEGVYAEVGPDPVVWI